MTGPARVEPPLTRAGPRPAPPPRVRRRGRARPLRLVPLLATLAATVWALSTNPFAAPFVDRSAADVALTLERAVRRTASAAWIEAALADAVARQDADRAAMLLGLADDLGRDVPRDAAAALVASRDGWGARVADCVACMADAAACPSTAALAACAVPFELSPLGDANALRRAGMAWAGGDEVDRLEAGLAAVGLGATAALVVTGGASATVKAGAGLMRTARRMGTLPLPVVRLARSAVRDPAARAALRAMAGDLGRIRAAAGTADALRLMRIVDGPQDAARLARVAEAAGPRTARTVAVLGKGRALRATLRLTRMAAGALALIWACLAQLGAILAARMGGAVWRAALGARR